MLDATSRSVPYDDDVDVLIAGSGGGGLSTAAVAAHAGRSVLVLERASRVGGTTRKSAGGVWIPNNKFMVAAGQPDDRTETLRYLARLARPTLYDPDSSTFGLPKWEYDGIANFYDNAAEAHEFLEEIGALELGQATNGLYDYLESIAENDNPQGRGLYQARSMGSPEGGQWLVDDFKAAAEHHDVEIRLECRVIDAIVDHGRVVGVVVESVGGELKHVHARVAVVFATGGFTHNADLRLQYLNGPYVGGCAARTNTGDFVTIASELGAELANMNQGWAGPIVLERHEREPDTAFLSFYTLGDAVLSVNCSGNRFANEKAPYNELGRTFASWDPVKIRYSNFPMITIWDQTVADRWAIDRMGNPIPAPDADGYWVVSGDSVEELAANIDTRLIELGMLVGRRRLDDGFVANLQATLERFAGFAASGVDEDFQRGETRFERYVSTRFGDGDGPNPLLRALDTSGRLYATILGPGLLDTKGGPRTDLEGRVLTVRGQVIPGLWGVGNAAASPLGQGYPGGGGTLGPIITAGYLAGRAIGTETIEPHAANVAVGQSVADG